MPLVEQFFLGTVRPAVKVLDIGNGYANRCGSNPAGDVKTWLKSIQQLSSTQLPNLQKNYYASELGFEPTTSGSVVRSYCHWSTVLVYANKNVDNGYINAN